MHEVSVPHPPLGLTTHFAILAFLVTLRSKRRAEVIDQILHQKARLGQYQRLWAVFRFDCDNGWLAQWVYLLKLGRREHVDSLESFELIVDFAFFKKPKDALSPGFLEPCCCQNLRIWLKEMIALLLEIGRESTIEIYRLYDDIYWRQWDCDMDIPNVFRCRNVSGWRFCVEIILFEQSGRDPLFRLRMQESLLLHMNFINPWEAICEHQKACIEHNLPVKCDLRPWISLHRGLFFASSDRRHCEYSQVWFTRNKDGNSIDVVTQEINISIDARAKDDWGTSAPEDNGALANQNCPGILLASAPSDFLSNFSTWIILKKKIGGQQRSIGNPNIRPRTGALR